MPKVFIIHNRKPKTRPAGGVLKAKALLARLAKVKHDSCVVDGKFDYLKMADLYHKGKW
jgi:hypothetical protein